MKLQRDGNGSEQTPADRVRGAGASIAPDEASLLLAELEATRRKLRLACRRIVKLRLQRKRSRVTLRRLKRLATTDVLTELYNRRRFEDALDNDFAQAVLSESPLSVILVDVDCFKSYNDTFGHAAGDVVLRAFARHLVDLARPTDLVSRYGGDEFAILLREADAVIAQGFADRFREAIRSFPWPSRPMTASLGIATRSPSIEDPAALVEEADRALYRYKRERRVGGDRRGSDEAGESSVSPFR